VICSGGVSAVMGSSDLDGLTLAIGEQLGNQPSCSLLFKPNQPIVGMACLALGTAPRNA